jgi:hypothetical protein
MSLTSSNYFSKEAAQEYWSVSQFKAFQKCEACGLAEAQGLYEREQTTSLLVGSYVDTYFTGEDKGALGRFGLEHPEIFNSRTGALKADFKHAETMINAVECQPRMREYLEGEYQTIKTAELFGVNWKIKMDVYRDGERIVDLKTVKDFEPLYKDGFGYVSWIEYWGYDIQAAIYQRVEQIASGRDKPLPFYIVAVTKEKTPDIAVIQIPQSVMDTALKVVESKIDEFDLVKQGEIPPQRCERCEWCKSTKILTEPSVYEAE